MTEREALLAAVCADPEDDTPRLVFADWLDENGEPDRAEFIRAQVRAGRIPDGAEKDALQARAKKLLEVRCDEWTAPLREFGDSDFYGEPFEFRRGFVEAVGPNPEVFVERGAELFALAPVRELWFGELEEYAALAECEHLLRVRTLDLTGSGLSQYFDPAPLLGSPYLANLTTLRLGGHDDNGHLDLAGVRALISSEHLRKLEELDLSGNWLNQFDPDTVATFLAGANFPVLRRLALRGVGLDDDDAALLAETWPPGRLRVLDLRRNGIGERGMRALLASPHLADIELLDLRSNRDWGTVYGGGLIRPETKRLLVERFGRRVLV